jgi:hypothetical protein
VTDRALLASLDELCPTPEAAVDLTWIDQTALPVRGRHALKTRIAQYLAHEQVLASRDI